MAQRDLASTSLAEIQYKIRPAASLEEAKPLWWQFMQSLGWNRSSYDLATYMSATISRGWLLLFPQSADKPVGHVAAIIYNNKTAWVAMFIVDPRSQGLGYGRALLRDAMIECTLHGTRYVGLDAVAEQKRTYERRGFFESPHGLVRCFGRPLLAHTPITSQPEAPRETVLVDIRTISPDLLVQSDLLHTGFERRGLWTSEFLNRRDLYGYALVKAQQAPITVEHLLAWIIVRRNSFGYRFGPVYANGAAAAQVVVVPAMEKATAESIRHTPMDNDTFSSLSVSELTEKAQLAVEIWGGNPAAPEVFEGLGWKSIGIDYHRMWLDCRPTPEQGDGGLAHKHMFAIYDAAIG